MTMVMLAPFGGAATRVFLLWTRESELHYSCYCYYM